MSGIRGSIAAGLAFAAIVILQCRDARTDPASRNPELTQPIVVTLTPAQPAGDPTFQPTGTPTPIVRDWQEAYALQQNGDYDRAIAAYRQLLTIGVMTDDASRTIRFHLGETYLLNGDPGAASAVLSAYVADYPDDAPGWFLLGRAREALADWAGAVEAYRRYRDRDTTLADHAGLRMADALVKLGRLEEASQTYQTIVETTPDSNVATGALERLAEIVLSRQDAATAGDWYAQAAGWAAQGPQQARLLGLAGTAYMAGDRRDDAVRVLRHIVDLYPDTDSAYMALRELTRLGEEVSLRTQGLVYFYNRDYRAAVEALVKYVETEAAPLGDAYYFLGRSYEGLSRWQHAITAYDRLIRNYPGNERFGAAWVRTARALRVLGETAEAVTAYKEFAHRYPEDALADDALWEAGRTLESLDKDDEAAQLYARLAARYPGGDYGQAAGFRAGILPYLHGAYATARDAWRAMAARAPTAEAKAQALLWAGKAALALGDRMAAQADFAAAAATAPWSFDGLRAQALGGHAPASHDPPASLGTWLGLSDASLADIDRRLQADRRYRRGMALLAVGLREEGIAELKALRDSLWQSPAQLARLAALLHDPAVRHLSIASAERVLILTDTPATEAPRELARLAFPAAYAGLVRAIARQYGIDPRLMMALIRQESRFNPAARSYANALGLTQVIPSTGAYIASKLGVAGFRTDSLYRPDRSIEFGTWYLAQQLEGFDGEPILALAAYNGGPGNARHWQSLADDLDVLVESIHLTQTREYVRRTMEQYAVYRALYEENLVFRFTKKLEIE